MCASLLGSSMLFTLFILMLPNTKFLPQKTELNNIECLENTLIQEFLISRSGPVLKKQSYNIYNCITSTL
jgi:hypothetical protein